MKVVRLTAQSTGRLYPLSFTFTHFYWRLIRPQGHSAAGRIMLMKIFNDTIEPATFRFVAQCLNKLRHRALYKTGSVVEKGKVVPDQAMRHIGRVDV